MFDRLVQAVVLAVLAFPSAAHPARGIAAVPDGRVYFSDLERIWMIRPDGRLVLIRSHRGAHTHALTLDRGGALVGEDSAFDPGTRNYLESIWEISPQGRFAYRFGPARVLPRGVGLQRDARGCTYHSDQTAQHGRPLVHRRCPGGPAERLVGSKVDDRTFRPVLANDVAGTAFAADSSFYFRYGRSIRRVTVDRHVTTVASGMADENLGIALDAAGAVYVAENANRRIVRVAADGRRSIAARSAAPWGPTGVTVLSGALYLLEATDDRRGVPLRMRVRRIDPRGPDRVLATVVVPDS